MLKFQVEPTNSAGEGTNVEKTRTGEFEKRTDVLDDYYKKAVSSINVLETGTAIIGNLTAELQGMFGLTANLERLAFLDEQSAAINKKLGLGTQKAGDFKDLIVQASSNYAELGLKMTDIGKDYVGISEAFGSNISISDENLTELAATSLVTGQKSEELAKSFRKVGVDVAGIAPRMMEVTKVAKESGAIVGQVSSLVVTNLQKLNTFNFEGGIKGLAKMSAQSAKLGIDMSKIFQIADDMFSPEKAIELSAAMQRLGVSTNALLDPLSLMDMGANDPVELQNQIVKMTKDFVKFNQETKSFEILPGEKRRLREIASALNMTSEELASMGINAANLDYKMKQIKFSPGTSKEDREMLASMAQINKQGVAEVKVKQTVINEKTGEEEFTGEYEMKAVGEISAKQFEALKESQELQGASMEEIALKQQGELEGLNNKVDAIKKAVGYGASGTQQLQAGYSMLTTGVKEKYVVKDKATDEGMFSPEMREAETYKAFVSKTLEVGKDGLNYLTEQIMSVTDFSSGLKAIENMFVAVVDYAKNFNFEALKTDIEKVAAEVKLEKESMGSYKANTMGLTLPAVTTTATQVSNLNATNTNTNTSSTNSNINVNNTTTVTVQLDEASKNQALSKFLNDEIDKYIKNPSNIVNIVNLTDSVKTANNTVISTVVK